MKVQEILTDESKWWTGSLAGDSDGKRITYTSEKACRFCLLGAIYKAYPTTPWVAERKIENATKLTTPGFNDTPGRTFAEVRALIEELDI